MNEITAPSATKISTTDGVSSKERGDMQKKNLKKPFGRNCTKTQKFKLFQDWMSVYLRELNAQDFRVQYALSSNTELEGTAARVISNPFSRVAEVAFNSDCHIFTNEEEIRKTALHEALHIRLSLLVTACSDKEVHEDWRTSEEESLVNCLERIIK